MENPTLSTIEKRLLTEYHLNGTMKAIKSKPIAERRSILTSLIERGYITTSCELTHKAHNEILRREYNG